MSQLVTGPAFANNWEARGYLMFGCQFDQIGLTPGSREQQECRELREAATAEIIDSDADAVFLLSTQSRTDGTEREFDDMPAWVERVVASGTEVVVVRDVPRFE